MGMIVRLLAAAVVALLSTFTYCSRTEVNPVTGQRQHVAVTARQEIGLGQEAAPRLEAEGGGPDRDLRLQELVDRVGARLVAGAGGAGPYPYDFTVLADERTVNAFALPGGEVFLTRALVVRLESEGQLAGVLGHEIAHVAARHGAQQLAKAQLAEGLSGAAALAAYDPDNPESLRRGQMAQLVGALLTMRFGREHELESDRLGVRFMAEAGYHPESLLRVMEILHESQPGGRPPEFLSTHPDPGNRLQHIRAEIQKAFPEGIPEGLTR